MVKSLSQLVNPLKPSGHYMYRTVVTICTTGFNVHKFYVLPTQCDYVYLFYSIIIIFLWISEQTAIISLYNINWLVFITETECVYCAVRTGYVVTVVTICTASLTFNNSTFCPHSVFMCFVWISEQTAIISLHALHLSAILNCELSAAHFPIALWRSTQNGLC